MTIQLTPPHLVREDLALIGLTLEGRPEACRDDDGRPCQTCGLLDGHHDADLLVTDVTNPVLRSIGRPAGAAYLVSYRDQRPDYDYRTITIRESNDRGNRNVQAAKIRGLRSVADLIVQAYPSGVAWAQTIDIRAAMLRDSGCAAHEARITGKHGQIALVFCQHCAAMHYKPRTEPKTYGDGWLSESAARQYGELSA